MSSRRRPPPDPRPLLRGRVHQYAAPVAAVAGGALVALASTPLARAAAAVYAVCLAAMLAISAVYQRVWWRSARARAVMRRLDHSGIFLAIAGTYTPFGLLLLDGWVAATVLALVWAGGLAGSVLAIARPAAPRWLSAVVYVAVGWAGLVSLPQLFGRGGVLVGSLVVCGGALYTLGAIVYARRRPDPAPAVFGYHELFHALVVVAAVVQFAAVAGVVL